MFYIWRFESLVFTKRSGKRRAGSADSHSLPHNSCHTACAGSARDRPELAK